MKCFLKKHGLTLFSMLFIITASSIPKLRAPDLGFRFMDKVIHFGVYLILGFFIQRSFRIERPLSTKLWMVVFFTGALFGASDEWHQSFVPGRTTDIFDWTADCAGIACGQWIFFKAAWRKWFGPFKFLVDF